MSRYLIDQIATPAEHPDAASLRGRRAPTATRRWRRSTSATRRPARRRGSTRAALFIFIGADAETDWLPPEIALDDRGYVLTGADVRDAGPLDARPRPLPARDERARASSPAATCASAR